MLGARGLSCLPLSKLVVEQGSKCAKDHVLSRALIHLINGFLDGLSLYKMNNIGI